MSGKRPFTVSSFYKFINENILMAAKCNECGTVILPPKPMCTQCLSINLKWIQMDDTGKLISYTIIHVAPEQFQSIAPYTVGIVEFNNGLRLPGIIRNVNPEEIKVGLDLIIDFDSQTSSEWPTWTRYFFKPL